MFIFRKEKSIPDDLCDAYIETFETCPASYRHRGVVSNEKDGVYQDKDIKLSTDISFTPNMETDSFWGDKVSYTVNTLYDAMLEFRSRYHVAFNNIDIFKVGNVFNMQKYEPGEAYYKYHCERAGMRHSNRILVWMIYLNNVYDGGETEFFYYHHYEPARKGTLLIWPTDWTHLHRGILSNTENKYILTGWYTFLTAEEKENEKD